MRCPHCAAENAQESPFCPQCGKPHAVEDLPTVDPPLSEVAAPAETGTSPPSEAFAPGDKVGGRYRIVSFLGRGGMGAVYRADDLKLGQAVALKFLSGEAADDPVRLDRLFTEARLAREVTHPNVCRVHDVGEVGGRHFISMEYVQGEDLESLLRRIGRLPQDKALDVARQLCAGLAAAHAKGVLHRDLKPANIMLDERGTVRISDFGLAVSGEEGARQGEVAGTPAYMAPEQLAGEAVSPSSDIFSLGLVLYELFTGSPAFSGRTVAELRRLHEGSSPRSPSSLIDGIDPIVESVILRCLERSPEDRPRSVVAVAATLPGGDPLAAALAAGETPSPQMIANAGGTGGMRPTLGLISMLIIIVGLIAQALNYDLQYLAGRVPLERPPEALSVTAREIVGQAGYEDPPADSVFGFEYDLDYVESVRAQEPSPTRWDELGTVRPAPIFFWYRQSPQYLVASDLFGNGSTTVGPDAPAWDFPGMVGVWLDPRGTLLRFKAVPPAVDGSKAAATPFDWSAFFDSAGLDPAALTPARPERNPLLDCDGRYAWEGFYPDQPDIPIRVEAGAYRGKAAYFEIVTPWRMRQMTTAERAGRSTFDLFLLVSLLVLMIGGSLLARRNMRLGRGDRRGASRLTVFVFISYLLWWVLSAHHVPTFGELWLFFNFLGFSLVVCGLVWIVYIALEPYARRMWPTGMITWSRLLTGRLRDPLIGRDILIGVLAGVVTRSWWSLYHILIGWLSLPGDEPVLGSLGALTGVRQALAMNINSVATALYMPMAWLFLVLLLRVLLRRQWLAVAVAVASVVLSSVAESSNPVLFSLFLTVAFGIFLFILLRVGLLAGVCWVLSMYASADVVLTADMSSWFAGRSLFTLLAVAALAAYGFYTSLAGRPLFRDDIVA